MQNSTDDDIILEKLDKIKENPRYYIWDSKIVDEVDQYTNTKYSMSIQKKANTLIVGYIQWCDANNIDIFNNKHSESLSAIEEGSRQSDTRELMQLMLVKNETKCSTPSKVIGMLVCVLFVYVIGNVIY